MSNNIKYIAFYTEGTGYEDEAKELVKTMQAFDLDYIVKPVRNLGSWQKNTQSKAEFILRMATQLPRDSGIVYIDADARFRAKPVLFDELQRDEKTDIAVHYLRGTELLGGTIYIRNNDKVRKVITDWIQRNCKEPETWDQKTLQYVVEHTRKLNVYKLPPSYCYIFDISKKLYIDSRPVIEHMQASRKLKDKVTSPPMVKLKSLMANNQRKHIVAALPENGKMLEWGSGGTTHKMLSEMKSSQHLTTVEHVSTWAEKVKLICEDFSNHDLKTIPANDESAIGKNATPFEENPTGLSDYINACDVSQFDVILVDGVARGACLMNVFTNAKSGAKVFLHDSNRDWYDWALQHPRIKSTSVIKADEGEYPPDLKEFEIA